MIMTLNSTGAWSILATAGPLLAVPGFFLIFYLKRTSWRQKKRRGRKYSGFSPSTFTLGIALQHLQAFTHPSVQYVLEEKYDEDAEEDDQGNPDHPKAQINRQLKRIRRGEPVDRLILRLK
jgi:hypothetical protein